MDGTQSAIPSRREGEPQVRILEHEQVLVAARQTFIREGRLDMRELAQELAVSRATLYRVVSSRERLLGDVLWSLGELSLAAAVQETQGKMDLQRILRIGSRFRELVLTSEELKTFVQAEPSTAAAALFTPGAGRQSLARAWEVLLLQAVEDQEASLTIGAAHAAEIIVSLGASMLYENVVSGQDSDTDLVAVVIHSLFLSTNPQGSP